MPLRSETKALAGAGLPAQITNDNVCLLGKHGVIEFFASKLALAAGPFVALLDERNPNIFGSSRNPGKHRNKSADLIDDVRANKHI